VQRAEANLRAALPSVQAYASDNFGSSGDVDRDAYTTGYTGMTVDLLRLVYAVKLDASLQVVRASPTSYCLQASDGEVAVSKDGPAAPMVPGLCPPR
jgi:hypothetical protein